MESTLTRTVADLAREVAGYLGFGRTPANWTGWNPNAPYVVTDQDSQLAWTMEAVESGLHQAYNPPLVDQTAPVAHEWRFLRPETTLTIQAAINEYDLPDAFGTLVDNMNYLPSDNAPDSVRYSGIGEVRGVLQRLSNTVGKPTLVAIQAKASDGSTGQRYRAIFAPMPDNTYTLLYRFVVQPYALTARYPYLLGPPGFSDTVLESCLAAAELRFQGERGMHWQHFMDRLRASISADIRDHAADFLGKNRDRTRVLSRWPGYDRHGWDNDLMTINGSVPG